MIKKSVSQRLTPDQRKIVQRWIDRINKAQEDLQHHTDDLTMVLAAIREDPEAEFSFNDMVFLTTEEVPDVEPKKSGE